MEIGGGGGVWGHSTQGFGGHNEDFGKGSEVIRSMFQIGSSEGTF